MHIKIFQGFDATTLEHEIAEWLERTPGVEIIAVSQSESHSHQKLWSLTITLVFRRY